MPKEKVKLVASRFRHVWLDNPQYKSWLQEDKTDSNKFYCKMCKQSVSLSNMGVGALRSHIASKRHKLQTPLKGVTDIRSCFAAGPSTSGGSSSSTSGLSGALHDIRSADILWALEMVQSNFSGNSCDNKFLLFQKMFPDSTIAKSSSMQRTKFAYTVNFGLAPFFFSDLLEKVKKSPFFAISFDESLNDQLEKVQMDFIVRFWDEITKRVETRYFGSEFLKYSNATALKQSFDKALKELDAKKMIQISMDGPNVNWSLFKKVEEERKLNNYPLLINIGSCALHIVHGAFENGSKQTQWNIKKLLSHLYKFFKQAPARRTFFTSTTGAVLFPKSFCGIRWLENKAVAERAIFLWNDIKKSVYKWEKLSKYDKPSGERYNTIKRAVSDVLVVAKLSFFCYICKIIEPFLTRFQQDNPIIPFMYEDIQNLFKKLLNIFLKDCDVDTAFKNITNVDLKDKKYHSKHVEVGCAAAQIISKLKTEDVVKHTEVMNFEAECRLFAIGVIEKLRRRILTPRAINFIKKASCLDPKKMSRPLAKSLKKFKELVLDLPSAKIISSGQGDEGIREFRMLLSKPEVSAKLVSYKPSERLDSFFFETLSMGEYKSLAIIVQTILVLHNGQAEIERGFSINKEVMKDNMSELTLVSRRLVKDYLRSNSLETYEVDISSRMINSVQQSSLKYKLFLKEKQEKEKTEALLKKKNEIREQLNVYKREKELKEKSLTALKEEEEAAFLQASSETDMTKVVVLLAKGKGLNEKAKKMMVEISELQKKIEEYRLKLVSE